MAQKSVLMFVHFLVMIWLWVKAWEYDGTIGTCLKALVTGVNLRYVAWEKDDIRWRYGNSILVTHWDTYLSLYQNHGIGLSMHDMINDICPRISYGIRKYKNNINKAKHWPFLASTTIYYRKSIKTCFDTIRQLLMRYHIFY